MSQAEVELVEVSKSYGATLVVDRMSLTLPRGELLALLGPSGCGKTTSLRIVAGFVDPTSGHVLLRGRDVTRVPPHKRDAGMVFQSYALFPHLTVAENIAFGLKRRGVPRPEIKDRVQRMIALLKLDRLEDRLPRHLSGGQQQRVAVGRALVINPTVILLDEPFSNLDAQLREGTRLELRRLQQELGLTAIFVTHDQAEAMSIADRIAIMNRGRIEQIGSPREVYHRPATRFVAEFVGSANVFEGEIATRGPDGVRVRAGQVLLRLPPVRELPERPILVLRPEAIAIASGSATAGADNELAGTVEVAAFYGATTRLVLRAQDGLGLIVEQAGDLSARFPPGMTVVARWSPDALVLCLR